MAGTALSRAWHRHAAAEDDRRLATAFAAGLGFTVTLTLAAVMTHLRAQASPTVDLGIFVAAVALAGWWMTRLGALMTAVLAFLMLNGFAVDQYAVLRWHGSADAVRLIVLLGCAGAVSVTRELQLRHRRRTADARLTHELTDVIRTTSVTREGPRHA